MRTYTFKCKDKAHINHMFVIYCKYLTDILKHKMSMFDLQNDRIVYNVWCKKILKHENEHALNLINNIDETR